MADDDYDVGYGKPPKHRQFKKGESGNPRGRPKGTRNFKTDLAEELQEKVRITEGGQTEEVSKQRAMVKRIMEKALKGDIRAVGLIGQWIMNHFGMEDEENNTEGLNEDDQAILDRFLSTQDRENPSALVDEDKFTKASEEKS